MFHCQILRFLQRASSWYYTFISFGKMFLISTDCPCFGLALATIISFNFSWSQTCLSPTCLCSRTLCMSCTSLIVLFLSGLASIWRLVRKSIRATVSKYLRESMLINRFDVLISRNDGFCWDRLTVTMQQRRDRKSVV